MEAPPTHPVTSQGSKQRPRLGSVCPRSPSSLVAQPALSFVWEASEAERGYVSPWPPHPWVGEGQSFLPHCCRVLVELLEALPTKQKAGPRHPTAHFPLPRVLASPGLGTSQSPSPQVWESPRLAGGVLVLTRGDPSVPTAILFLLTPGKQQSQDTLSAGQHEKEADSWGLLAAVCSPRNEYLQSPGETEKETRLQCNYIS